MTEETVNTHQDECDSAYDHLIFIGKKINLVKFSKKASLFFYSQTNLFCIVIINSFIGFFESAIKKYNQYIFFTFC